MEVRRLSDVICLALRATRYRTWQHGNIALAESSFALLSRSYDVARREPPCDRQILWALGELLGNTGVLGASSIDVHVSRRPHVCKESH